MFAHRLRRGSNIESALGQRFISAGSMVNKSVTALLYHYNLELEDMW